MKRLSTIIMALAVIMGMTRCTKPAMQLYDGTYTGVTKEITFSTGGSSKVEINNVLNELEFTWKTGDTLYVYGSKTGTFSDGRYCGKLGIVKGMGTENGFFSGTLENVPETGTLRFYYCPNELFDKEQKTITVDLSSQDGSLNDPNGIASHLVACADVTVMESGDYSATLTVPYSVVKFDLSAFGTTDITMSGITNSGLTVTANGVKNVSTGGITSLSGADVTTNTCYVSVMPENVTTLTFSGNDIVVSLPATLTENTFETLNNGGDPVPVAVETDEWINFNDETMGVTGLPIWSKYNLGANVDRILNDFENAVATDWYGDYYAWGEIEPHYTGITWTAYNACSFDGWKTGKTGYNWETYQWCNGTFNTLTKYNIESYYGTVDNKYRLEAADDAAYQNATPAHTWRMPTGFDGEWFQLTKNTLFVWTTSYRGITDLIGYVVYKVKATAHKGQRAYSDGNGGYDGYSGYTYALTDPHMFLPAVGCLSGTSLSFADSWGMYWSNMLGGYGPTTGNVIYFTSGQTYTFTEGSRYAGHTVRPVR